VSLALLAGVVVAVLVLGLPPGPNLAARQRAEADSFRALARAGPAEELTRAVGDLGVVLRPRIGGWVAVRYRDSHVGGIWSSAVARDSGGAWFVSDRHYCGRIAVYRRWREQPEGPGLPADAELRALEEGDLDSARGGLEARGFRRVSPPGQ
jgi:hypothetical protein